MEDRRQRGQDRRVLPAPALMFGNRCERVLTSPVCPWLGRGPFSPPCTTPHHTHTQFAPALCRHRCGHERCAGARPHRRRHQQRAVSASSAAAAWPIPEHWVETVHVVGVLTAPRPPQAVAMAPPCCLRPMPTPRALVIPFERLAPAQAGGHPAQSELLLLQGAHAALPGPSGTGGLPCPHARHPHTQEQHRVVQCWY